MKTQLITFYYEKAKRLHQGIYSKPWLDQNYLSGKIKASNQL
jgi:hypothetical protein